MNALFSTSQPIDLNDTSSFAKFSGLATTDRGWFDVQQFKKATIYIDPEAAASTAVVTVFYSLDRNNEIAFASGSTITLSLAQALTIDIADVPFIRVRTSTAEGSALVGHAHIFLANLDIPQGGFTNG